MLISYSVEWSHTLTLANAKKLENRQLNKLHIIPLKSLAKVTCSLWRLFLCFQIFRMNFSQMLPLPDLSYRMPCCITFVPVGNTYATFGPNYFALTPLFNEPEYIIIIDFKYYFCL